jgi:hypothetical protein
MPTPAEILKKVRRIEVSTRRLVDEVFGGQYHSTFRGRGMEFSEVREYSPGDDVRAIDWNVTARAGRPFVKKFIEERELTVMLLVDVSASQGFGTRRQWKSDLAAEIAALIALSALTLGSTVYAEDGVLKEDTAKVHQDRKDLHQDNQEIKATREKIQQDKKDGNVEQLKKDRQALHEEKRNRREERQRLRQDRRNRRHDARAAHVK